MNPLRLMDPDAAMRDLAADLSVPLPHPLVRASQSEALRRLARDAGVTLPAILYGDVSECVERIRAGAEASWMGAEPQWFQDMAILGGILPEVAMSFIDGNGAWTESGGAAALTTVLGEDPTGGLEAGFADAEFDPADVTANGLVGDGSFAVAFNGAALTKILAGATLVFTLRKITGANTFSCLLVGNADASKFLVGGEDAATVNCKMYSFVAVDESITNCLTTAASPGALNKIAITLTPTRFEMSVNGSAADAVVLDTSEFENMVCAGMFPPQASQGSIVSIGIYDPVALVNLPTVST